MKPLHERLLSKVQADSGTSCWNWTASKFRYGYGQINDGTGKMRSAHRVSYEFHCGKIPEGLHVLHKCDNRACINPEHLFLGTNAENVADMVAKGRQPHLRGIHNGRAKLTEADILGIRSAEGVLHRDLATQYGVSKQQISKIRSNKLWEHI